MNNVLPLTSRYFTQAMQVYADVVPHPIFVIVTDDPPWARRNIHKSFKWSVTGKKKFLYPLIKHFVHIDKY